MDQDHGDQPEDTWCWQCCKRCLHPFIQYLDLGAESQVLRQHSRKQMNTFASWIQVWLGNKTAQESTNLVEFITCRGSVFLLIWNDIVVIVVNEHSVQLTLRVPEWSQLYTFPAATERQPDLVGQLLFQNKRAQFGTHPPISGSPPPLLSLTFALWWAPLYPSLEHRNSTSEVNLLSSRNWGEINLLVLPIFFFYSLWPQQVKSSNVFPVGPWRTTTAHFIYFQTWVRTSTKRRFSLLFFFFWVILFVVSQFWVS